MGEEVAEAAYAVEGVANDQKRPSLPDDLEGAGQRALLVGVVAGKSHASILAHVCSVTEPTAIVEVVRSLNEEGRSPLPALAAADDDLDGFAPTTGS